jgi:hypothetical protein
MGGGEDADNVEKLGVAPNGFSNGEVVCIGPDVIWLLLREAGVGGAPRRGCWLVAPCERTLALRIGGTRAFHSLVLEDEIASS